MRKYLMGISAAAIVALAAGCGGSDDAGSPGMDHGRTTSSTAADGAARAEHNEQDIAFAQSMIPHHQQAIDMAKMAAEKASDRKVKDLAARIDGAQGPEIEELTAMLEAWGAPTGSSMPGMDHGDMSSGSGMMTDEQMRQLEQASGADFDRMWLRMMIEHHQGAVDMSTMELETGANAEAKAMAQKIIDAQEAEITEMRGMA